MKNKSLLSLLFLSVTLYSFTGPRRVSKQIAPQRLDKPKTMLEVGDIFIVYHGQKIKMMGISLKNVLSIFGKPLQTKKEKWEVNDARLTRTLIYSDGELIFEDNNLAFVTIKKSGWAFLFKTPKGFRGPFTVGTDAVSLPKMYPGSYHKSKNSFSLSIDGCDCSLFFETQGVKIISSGLFSDES